MYDPGPDLFSDACIPLHRNENLFVQPPFLKDLVLQASNDILFNSYPDSTSFELRKAIAKDHNCLPEEVYIGNGADGVLADIFSLLRNEFHEIGTRQLTYQVYPYLCKRYGYQQKKLDETQQIWVIDSPSSINGETFDFSAIIAPPKFLIWDHVYGEFDTDHVVTLTQSNTRLVKIYSFSKFFALAALRVGYCIGDTRFISSLLSRKDIFNVNAIAQKTAILALNHKAYFKTQMERMFLAKKNLISGLIKYGFLVTSGKANFVWVTHPDIKMIYLQEKLAQHNILVRRFSVDQMENHLRITIPEQAIIDKLLACISNIINTQ